MDSTPAMCRCGHSRSVHEHYRRGDDCGACGSSVCARYVMAADDNVVHFRGQVVRRLRARGVAAVPLVATAGSVALAVEGGAAPSVDTESPTAV